MRSRFMLASAVVESDAFFSMSLEAQVAYVHLLANAGIDGCIIGVRRLIRGMGLDEDTLDELLESGFLLDVNGTVYDRFTWVNNKFATRQFARMADNADYRDGRLLFEGEEGRSPYTTPGRRQSVAKASHERREDGDAERPIERNDNAPSTQDTAKTPPSQENQQLHQQGNSPSAIPPNDPKISRCICLRCGGIAQTWEDAETGHWMVSCSECGSQYDYQREREAQAR